ncbi:MAG: transcriptional regulator [Endozoicomonas sp.]
MSLLSLTTPHELQTKLANAIRSKRENRKLSRQSLSERSTVPVSTLKRFESTGEISLRQFLLLWQTVDQLERLEALTRDEPDMPRSIDEVLSNG